MQFSPISERADSEAAARWDHAEENARLAAIVACSPDAIVSVAAEDGRILTWNPAAEQLFGYPEQEAIGAPITMLVPDSLGEGPQSLLNAALEGRPVKTDTVRRRKDGTLVEVSVTAARIRSPDGRVIAAVGIFRDITERKRLEAAQRESEAQFRALADAMPQMVWSATPEGRTDYYNLRWHAYVGSTEPGPADESWLELLHPDDRARVLESWRRAMASGIDYETEYRLRRHDGVYRWFLVRALPLRNQAGRFLRWFGTCTDIDDQKQAEMEHRRLSEVVEQSPDFIGYSAPDGRTLYINPAGRRMIGLPESVPADQIRFEDYFHPKDWRLVETRLLRQIQVSGQWSGEFRLRRFDTGETVPVDYRLFTTYDSAGNPTGLAAVTRDISARKRAEDARQLLIRELNHRVKNLFAVAAGIVSVSARRTSSTREMAKVVRGRLGALARAHDLIRAAITAESVGEEATTLRDIAAAIITPHASDEGGQIVFEGPLVPIGAGAATSVALVLHELATNAVKYGALSTHEGQVCISWSTADSQVMLEWKESGGPCIESPPGVEGFGTQLARMSVTGQLGGEIQTRWERVGVQVRITIPFDRLQR